jgi:hypothetical protein
MNTVIEFPDAEAREVGHLAHLSVSANAPVVDVDKLHAEAFEEIEADIVDIDHMAEIARDLIMNCRAAHGERELPSWTGNLRRFPDGEDDGRLTKKISGPLGRRMGAAVSQLTPQDVLSDLFEELLMPNSKELAAAVVQRLLDAGFAIVDWKEARRPE